MKQNWILFFGQIFSVLGLAGLLLNFFIWEDMVLAIVCGLMAGISIVLNLKIILRFRKHSRVS